MEKPGRDSRQVNYYLKYSGMALQLFVLMALGAFLGQWLDKRLLTSRPYFTIILILLFTGGFFFRLVKDLNRRDEP